MADKNKEELQDYEGGYGGGRQRVEAMHEHAFGERGWTNRGGDEPGETRRTEAEMPEGVRETHGPNWQEKFAKENSDKYGQSGGQPIEQRGASQSSDGKPEEEGLGDTRNVTPRGGYGSKETEKWPQTDDENERVKERRPIS